MLTASLPPQHPPQPWPVSVPLDLPLFSRSRCPQPGPPSSEHPQPRSWKNFSKFWLPLSMPTFPRLVGNGHLVLIVLRLGHHHGGQWSHKVVLERQVQGLGREVLLLIAKSIFAAERSRAGGSARKSSLPAFPALTPSTRPRAPEAAGGPPSPQDEDH